MTKKINSNCAMNEGEMKTYITLEHAYSYGLSIQGGRYLTAKEKERYNPEYRDYMMVGMGEHINLEYVTWADCPNREPDGEFRGCGNSVWIITKAEKDKYLALEAQRKKAAKEKKIAQEIQDLEREMEIAKKNGIASTKAEANRIMKDWNDIYNEGGYGYVPYTYCQDEYDYMAKKLLELKAIIEEK